MVGKKTEREKIYQPKNTLSRGYTALQSSFKWQKNPPGNKTGRISDSEKAPPKEHPSREKLPKIPIAFSRVPYSYAG